MPRLIQPTIQQMRLLEAVARHRSITRAAEEVNLTQPSVSMQIKALEEKVGMSLTELVGRKLQLTRAGEEVLAASRDILSRISELETALEDIDRKVSGPLSIATVSSAKYFLPQILGRFKRRYPGVEPRLQITNRETVLERVAQNLDDLYIMGRFPEDAPVNADQFMENIIVFAARPDHPLVRQSNIPLARIAEEQIILRETGSGTRKAVEALCAPKQVSLNAHLQFDDSEAIKQAVISGLGIAYLSLHSLRLELAAGELAILDVENFPLRRRWFALHRRGKRLSNTANSFLDYLLDERQSGHRNTESTVPSGIFPRSDG